MFNVGDKIVYPMHGAGTIDAIEEKDILGEKQNYYIIKMPGEVKVMVPISKASDIGVRSVIDKAEAGKVLEVLEANETEMSNNWNKRYKENMERTAGHFMMQGWKKSRENDICYIFQMSLPA